MGTQRANTRGHIANLIDFAPLPVIPFYQCRIILEKVDGCRLGPYASGGGNGRRIMTKVKTAGPTNGLNWQNW